jgi:hypothetical protein
MALHTPFLQTPSSFACLPEKSSAALSRSPGWCVLWVHATRHLENRKLAGLLKEDGEGFLLLDSPDL